MKKWREKNHDHYKKYPKKYHTNLSILATTNALPKLLSILKK